MALAEEKDKAAAHVARPNLGGSRVRARMGGEGSARRGQHGGRTRACIEIFSISFFFWVRCFGTYHTLVSLLPARAVLLGTGSLAAALTMPAAVAPHLVTSAIFLLAYPLSVNFFSPKGPRSLIQLRKGPRKGVEEKGQGAGGFFPGVGLRSESGRQGRQCLCPQPGLCRRTRRPRAGPDADPATGAGC